MVTDMMAKRPNAQGIKDNLNDMFDASPLSTYDDDRRTPVKVTFSKDVGFKALEPLHFSFKPSSSKPSNLSQTLAPGFSASVNDPFGLVVVFAETLLRLVNLFRHLFTRLYHRLNPLSC